MSGLTKRVRGANAPQANTTAGIGGGSQAGTVAAHASVDVVTTLLEHLSSDLERDSDR